MIESSCFHTLNGRGMQKKYQIFVSSTFRDLADERQDAIRSILDLGHIPAGMELFPAADTEQLSYIKKVIDECDYYVLIMGGRYGSLDEEGVSFTEREYDYAVETGKVVLAFVHGDASMIPVGKSDTAPRLVENLDQFRDKVMSGRLVRQWTTRENLDTMVVKSIARATQEYPAVGWIRGDAVASEDLLTQINSLRNENEALRQSLTEIKRSQTPKIDNLAPLSTQVTLRYHYNVYHGGFPTEHSSSFVATWEELFKAIAPSFLSAGSRNDVAGGIHTLAKEVKQIQATPRVFSTDVAMVENQLFALGLIKYLDHVSVAGGPGKGIVLTERGRAQLTELLAVRA
ncbi:DUF4062 domain-containing protein [Novosphingobium sp. M1R2S20]|uniref:DUF4062 domain-containing protein n=1 Tax=Novosphingobium rhizovicinum TaxID=3228928 RepID=A0ABV3R7P6_9SPHN